MLLKTNIISLALAATGLALSGYHFVMGFGIGNHLWVGLVGGGLIAAAFGAHRLLSGDN